MLVQNGTILMTICLLNLKQIKKLNLFASTSFCSVRLKGKNFSCLGDDICNANMTNRWRDSRKILKWWYVAQPASLSLYVCTVGQWAPCMWPPQWHHFSDATNWYVFLPPQQTPLSLHSSPKLISAGICFTALNANTNNKVSTVTCFWFFRE